MSKNILFISAAHETPLVYQILRELKDQGNKLYLISDIDTEPPAGLFEKEYLFDITKTIPTFEFVKNLGIHFDATITKSVDPLTPLIALVNKHYGAVGNDPKTAFYSRSKYHMRKKMEEAGVPGPKFRLCKNYEDLKKAVDEIGIPCVAKPIGWHSSFGTFMLRDKKDLENLESNYKTSLDFMLSQPTEVCPFAKEELELIGVENDVDMVTDYIVEGFLDGPEITIDAIIQDGKVNILGMEEQIIMDPPYFVRLGGIMPFRCDEKQKKEIEELLGNITKALGIKNSATHTEIIFTPDGPRLVEIACRSGSDNLHDSIYHMTGHSMLYETAMITLGIPRTYETEPRNHIATEYILPIQKGTIAGITIPKEFENNPDIVDLKIIVEKGSVVAPPPHNFDYLGYISVKGKTREEAQKKLKENIEKIKVTFAENE